MLHSAYEMIGKEVIECCIQQKEGGKEEVVMLHQVELEFTHLKLVRAYALRIKYFCGTTIASIQ